MTRQHPQIRRFPVLGLILASLVIGLSCGEEELTGPGERTIDVAGKPASTGDPTVTATVPNTAPQDTTLDVQVTGSGFDRGSRADLALDGVVSPKVKTNSTRFVNKSTLIANITIAADADPDLYDVIVTTTKGKRGIGIELFEVSYRMTIIGVLPQHTGGAAVSISELGEVFGGSARSVGSYWDERIFIWQNGVMEEVGPGTVIAASENRRVVSATPPAVWQEINGIWQETPLPELPGSLGGSQAQNISPDGTAIVGASNGESVLWRESGGGWTIEILPASCPCDINASGMIVGHDRVWTHENGAWTSQTLAASPAGSTVLGWAINDNGDVAGWSEDGSQGGYRRALLWRKTPTGWGPPEYLGSLGGDSSAHAINNAGYVVGSSDVPGQESPTGFNRQHAFVWTPFDGMVDLGSWDTDNTAYDINDLGQIVGVSRKSTGGNFSGDGTAVLWELQ